MKNLSFNQERLYSLNMPSLEDQIYTISKNISTFESNELPIESISVSEKDVEFSEFSNEDDQEELEELVEEMDEMDLLEWMEKNQDSLQICSSLFKDSINESIYKDLFEKGLYIQDDFLSQSKADEYYNLALEQVKLGDLKDPKRTKEDQEDPFRDNDARKDVIKWLKSDQQEYKDVLRKLIDLQHSLSEVIHLNGGMEFQLACYQSHGTYYQVSFTFLKRVHIILET